jgi:hypothetical protein
LGKAAEKGFRRELGSVDAVELRAAEAAEAVELWLEPPFYHTM